MNRRIFILFVIPGVCVAIAAYGVGRVMKEKAQAQAQNAQSETEERQAESLPHRPNRLAASTSAYLRDAMYQPVDWYEWGPEALEAARREDKPILLDIGGAWCHWCHVMDHESYENPEIARLINSMFIPVKVDRDARPDVDQRYQRTVSALTGQGGWPLTAFLTPDGKAFFGGTYFPPEDRWGRIGMRSLLPQVYGAFRDQREKVEGQAQEIARQLETLGAQAVQSGPVSEDLVRAIYEGIARDFDWRYGGFGGQPGQPKFPHPGAIELALACYSRTREQNALKLVTQTLTAQALGGMYDHLGGGFHRYSVDERWRVPHFEKMSYDNSEHLRNYLHAFQATRSGVRDQGSGVSDLFRRVAEETIEWINRDLSDREHGGFYASQDADNAPGDDGDYFTWTVGEVNEALPPETAQVIRLYYEVEEHGEMHHDPSRNVLRVTLTGEQIAKVLGKDVEEVERRIAEGKRLLLEARSRRQAPKVDTNVIAQYNGMMISAYLEAFRVLGDEKARDFALRSLDGILQLCMDPQTGALSHRIAEGQAFGPMGLLADQVWIATAALDAYEVTGEPRYLASARKLMDYALEHLWDGESGGFFDIPTDKAALGALSERLKPFEDQPSPSANAMAAMVLDRLYALTQEEIYRVNAERALAAFAGTAAKYSTFVGSFGLAVDLHIHHPTQVVVVGGQEEEGTQALARAAWRAFRPGKIVLIASPDDQAVPEPGRQVARSRVHSGPPTAPEGATWQGASPLPPPVATILGAGKRSEEPLAYVCAGTACASPTSDPTQLAELVTHFGVTADQDSPWRIDAD